MAVLSRFLTPNGRAVGTPDSAAAEEAGGEPCDLSLSGSLDRLSAPGVKKVILDEASRHREIRIDLSGLERIDGARLATLVEAFAVARREGVSMSFHRPSESFRRALALTRLDQVFPVSDSDSVALPNPRL